MKNYKLMIRITLCMLFFLSISSCTKENLNDLKNDLIGNLESHQYLINVTYLDRAFEGYEHNITLLGRQDRNEENPYRYQFEDYYTKARIPADFRPTNMVNKFRSDRTLSGMRGYFKYKKITTENRSFGIKIEVLQDGKLYKTYFLNNNPTGGYSNYAPEGVLEIAIY